MPRATRHYRLRIRNAADSADDLILTSVPGGTNPYLTGPPQGDGQEIDPATGESSIGAYMIEAADVSEVVTAALVDGDGRQTLIQRRAYLELSTDGGSSWPTVLVPGFINAYRLVTPMSFAFTIGESRRIEYARKVWDRTTDNFDRATCLIGGPIKGNWGPIIDRGGWRFVVTDSDATTVTLRVIFGSFPIDASTPRYQYGSSMTPYARKRANSLAGAERVLTETAADTATYPGIVVLVQTEDGTEVDRFTPRAQSGLMGSSTHVLFTRRDGVKLLRAGTVWAGSPPSNDTIFRLYAWRTTIGEDNPLHIDKHPVDILTDLWDEAGKGYDSTEAATVRGLLGDSTRLTLRITESWNLRDVEQMIGGLFGFSSRVGTDGELELITTRVRGIAAPASSYDDDDLRSPNTVIFEVDEQSIYNTVTIEQLRFERWGLGIGGDRPNDEVVALPRTRSFDLDSEGGGTPDSDSFGIQELLFTVPGSVAIDVSGQTLGDSYFEHGLAAEVFDRYGRGGVYGTVAALPTITEKVGEELRLDVSHLPNAGVRGGERILQIVRRTETPSGPELLLLDSGPNSQFGTAPTFSLAAGVADARKYVDVSITNASALNTAGAWLRIKWGVADSEPSSGSLLTMYTAGEIPSSFTTPAVNAGSHVWIRMQAFIPNSRPTSYTAWQNVNLTDLTAPSSLSESAGSDPARITITFTAGESDIPIEVLQRPQGDPADEARVVDSLSPGSDRVTLTLIPGNSYTIGIRHRERQHFGGVSSTTEISFTVAGSPDTLPAPTKPFAVGIKWAMGSIGGISGAGDPADQYAVGLRVRSAIDEGFIEFEMATETAVGSGTPGSYSLQETQPVSGVNETYIFTKDVPLDGKLRYLRARHVRVGATASPYTSVVSIMPGTLISPLLPVDPENPTVEITSTAEGATTETFTITATAGPNGSSNLEVRSRTKTAGGDWGAWSAWFASPKTGVVVTRHAKREMWIQAVARDVDRGNIESTPLATPVAPRLTFFEEDGDAIRDRIWDDGDYAGRFTTSDGFTQHNSGKESGGKFVNRMYAKALAGDPDTFDAVVDGATYFRTTANQRDGGGRGYSAIDAGNVVVAAGVDLSRAYTNKNQDNIGDGATYFRTTVNQRDGGGRGYGALASASQIASGTTESGGKAVNRLYAKSLAGDSDNADSIADGAAQRVTTLNETTGAARAYNTTDSSERYTAVNQPRTRVKRTGSQAITTSTKTKVNWTAEDYDVGTMHDNATNNTRLTAPIAGLYKVTVQIVTNEITSGQFIQIFFQKNGVDITDFITTIAANFTTPLIFSITDEAAASDYYECAIYHTHGSDRHVLLQSRFMAEKLW